MPFVVIVSNNEGGCPATVHATLADVKVYLRAYVAESDPPLDRDERFNFDRDLEMLTGECTQSVSGSEAWKETICVAPIDEQQNDGGEPWIAEKS